MAISDLSGVLGRIHDAADGHDGAVAGRATQGAAVRRDDVDRASVGAERAAAATRLTKTARDATRPGPLAHRGDRGVHAARAGGCAHAAEPPNPKRRAAPPSADSAGR